MRRAGFVRQPTQDGSLTKVERMAQVQSSGESRRALATSAIAMGNLVTCITLLVLVHHSILAYHPFAPAPQASLTAEPRSWLGFPILDAKRSFTLFLVATFNDIFFMSLLFFVSGLFVWQSRLRKGSRVFLRDRVIRLGVPFAVVAALLAPLAYYPSYLVTRSAPSLSAFAEVWLSLGTWPAGPVWFLWVLLLFDVVFVVLLTLAPSTADALAHAASAARRCPSILGALVAAASFAAYLPLMIACGPGTWSTLGPFTFQTSRLLHYLVYFLAGVAVGIHGLERGLLAADGELARRWAVWVAVAAIAFASALAGLAAVRSSDGSTSVTVVAGLAFALSCIASSFAVLAVFVRFARSGTWLFDRLRGNAYGMYLVHFTFVGWLQYALLPSELPAMAKAALVAAGTIAASWATTVALRRVPAIARVICA